jgi:hypothetical protein
MPVGFGSGRGSRVKMASMDVAIIAQEGRSGDTRGKNGKSGFHWDAGFTGISSIITASQHICTLVEDATLHWYDFPENNYSIETVKSAYPSRQFSRLDWCHCKTCPELCVYRCISALGMVCLGTKPVRREFIRHECVAEDQCCFWNSVCRLGLSEG